MEFLVLSLLVSHVPSTRILGSSPYPEGEAKELRHFIAQDEASYALRYLLKLSLSKFLKDYERLLARGDRADWAAMCFGICLVLLGIETFQVDVHLRTPGTSKPRSLCELMEMKSVNRLTELFHACTGGSSPLSLDWSGRRNLPLVNNDVDTAAALWGLQNLSDRYCE